MFIYEGIGGLVLFLAMAVLAIYFYGRMCRDAGYEEGRCDQYAALGELAGIAELADLTPALEPSGPYPGRHARTQPRQLAASVPPAPDSPSETPEPENRAERPPWVREIPGPGRPQPGRDSYPGTARLPRHGSIAYALAEAGVRPRIGLPATTGEMAAVTDQFIEDMRAEEAAYRHALTAGTES